jgi:hypothetical protein
MWFQDTYNRLVGAFPSLSVGSSSNLVTITDKGIVLSGTSTVFDDLLRSALQLKVFGPGVSINSTENTLEFTTTSNLSDYSYDNYPLVHAWKIGSVVFPHILWEQAENYIPNWLLQYRWQTNGQAKITSWTNVACTTNIFAYTSGTLNQISYVNGGIAPPTGAGLSDIIEFRILRDNSNTSGVFSGTNTYTTTVGMTSVGIHVEIDTLGSKEEYVK